MKVMKRGSDGKHYYVSVVDEKEEESDA